MKLNFESLNPDKNLSDSEGVKLDRSLEIDKNLKIDNIVYEVNKYNSVMEKYQNGDDERYSREDLELLEDKISEQFSKLTKDEKKENIFRLPYKFRIHEYTSLETLDQKINFDDETKKIATEILKKYIDYPEVSAIILESINECCYLTDKRYRYTTEMANRDMATYNREDVFEVVKYFEDHLSGNEAHLLSRTHELGSDFLDKNGKDYFDLVRNYHDAPIFIEHFSRNILGHYGSCEELERLVDSECEGEENNYEKKRDIKAQKLIPFYSDPVIKKEITDRYNDKYFFLADLKPLILNNDKQALKNYSISNRFTETVSDDQLADNFKKLLGYKEFIEVQLGRSNANCAWGYNLLINEAEKRGMLNEVERCELLDRLDNEAKAIVDEYVKKMAVKYQIPELKQDNEKQIIEYLTNFITTANSRDGYKIWDIKFDWVKNKVSYKSGFSERSYGGGSLDLSTEDFVKDIVNSKTSYGSDYRFLEKLQSEYFKRFIKSESVN